ncbi:MAG: hypothetical protein U0031_23660 [Thermomicrobiales bacterium]
MKRRFALAAVALVVLLALGVVARPQPEPEAPPSGPTAVSGTPRANAETASPAVVAIHTSDTRAELSDGAVAGAWRRNGCQVNPGNPACLTVTLAATCARHPATSGCAVDRDGDRCTDVSEVLIGLDPFDGGDCLSNSAGAPAINCLFPVGNLPCDEFPGFPRGRGPTTPAVDCAWRERYPGCDGFAPEQG